MTSSDMAPEMAEDISLQAGVFSADLQVPVAAWHDAVPQLPALAQQVLEGVSDLLDITPGEVALVFTDDAAVQVLNREYRQKDAPTNVLSFALMDGDEDEAFYDLTDATVYGDVVIALETMQREALEQDKDLKAHVMHLMTHGVLHLLGFDHITDEEAQEMEDLEREILDKLGVSDPYKLK